MSNPVISVGLDGCSITITCQDKRDVELVRFLFDSVSDGVHECATVPSARFSIVQEPGNDRWVLSKDLEQLYAGNDLNALGTVLAGEALASLIEQNQHALAIHAGLVSKPNGSLMLPAESGSGKTSVTGWLLTQGWNYHTDELVLIDIKSGAISAFCRPLNVKTSGIRSFSELIDLDAVNSSIRRCENVTMIPHRLFSQDLESSDPSNDVDRRIPPLTAIVFPSYQPDGAPSMEKLSGAQAGLDLMRNNVIARNLPGHGFQDIAGLVRDVPAWRLRYRKFSELERLFSDSI